MTMNNLVIIINESKNWSMIFGCTIRMEYVEKYLYILSNHLKVLLFLCLFYLKAYEFKPEYLNVDNNFER